MTEGIEREKLLLFVGETEMEDLGVVEIKNLRILSDKKRCDPEFVKKPDLNE